MFAPKNPEVLYVCLYILFAVVVLLSRRNELQKHSPDSTWLALLKGMREVLANGEFEQVRVSLRSGCKWS